MTDRGALSQERLRGSWLKVQRARKHIDELRGAVEAFVQRDICRLVVTDDEATGNQIYTMHLTEEIPEEFALILGDAVHNLRSALDLAACSLVSAKGKSAKQVRFPFSKEADGFQEALDKSLIRRAGKAVTSFIEGMQPYYGGYCERLRCLHDLDIIDKHKLIVPVVTKATLTPEDFAGYDFADSIFTWVKGTPTTFSFTLRDGLQFISGTSLPRVENGHEFKPSFDIGFGRGPFERDTILPTLLNLADFVTDFLDELAALA